MIAAPKVALSKNLLSIWLLPRSGDSVGSMPGNSNARDCIELCMVAIMITATMQESPRRHPFL